MPKDKLRLIILVAVISLFLQPNSAQPLQHELKVLSPKPIKTVYPVYPEHLKREGIAGEVIIWALIDEQGNVKIQGRPRHILRSLHPELDELATEAAKKWKYAPSLIQGKPRKVWTYISITFDPGELPEEEDPASKEPLSDELKVILDRSWEYCRKIDDVAHFYLCREKISQAIKSIVNVGKSMMGSFGDELHSTYKVKSIVPDLANPERIQFINEYQITSQNSLVTELRTPVKPPPNERISPFIMRPLSFPIPINVPALLLGPGFRDEFIYSLGKDEKILGENCQVIDIRSRRKRGVRILEATIWVERNSARVVQAEVKCGSSAIDKRILTECQQYYLVPHMRVTYEYGIEKKGILFPSRSEVVLDYSQLGRTNTQDTKMKLDIRYDKYRFFTVETDSAIKKSVH